MLCIIQKKGKSYPSLRSFEFNRNIRFAQNPHRRYRHSPLRIRRFETIKNKWYCKMLEFTWFDLWIKLKWNGRSKWSIPETMMSEREYRYIRRTRRQLYRMLHAIRILQNEQRDKRATNRARRRHINQVKDEVRLLQDERILQRLQRPWSTTSLLGENPFFTIHMNS